MAYTDEFTGSGGLEGDGCKHCASKVAKEPFQGHSSMTKTFASPMSGFVINNDGDTDLKVTIGSETYTVKGGERFAEHFEPFLEVVITGAVPYRAYARQTSIKDGGPVIPPADTTPPADATDLAATDVAATSLTLNWSASVSADVAGYDIYLDYNFIAHTADTAYTITGLAPETEYTISVRARDAAGNAASGADIVIATSPEPVNPSLLFALDFTNRAGNADNVIYDRVSGEPCSLMNVDHDGTDGYVDDRGLTLSRRGYVNINTNRAPLQGTINLNAGVTFEMWLYNPYGVIFRTDPNHLTVKMTDHSWCRMQYISSETRAAKELTVLNAYHMDPVGVQSNRKVTGIFHPVNELNVVTVCFDPDGRRRWYVNGWRAVEGAPPADFAGFSNPQDAHPLQLWRDEVSTNRNGTTLRSFQIYNKAHSDEEIYQRYNAIKAQEALVDVMVHPNELKLKPGETAVVAVTTEPVRYGALSSHQYESGNEAFFTVSPSGLVSALMEGASELTVRTQYRDRQFVTTIPVYIGYDNALPPPETTREIADIAFNRSIQSLEVGESAAAMATALPFDVFNDNYISWSSSNPSVCLVNYGVLTGVSEGTSVITATDASGKHARSFEATVTIPREGEALLDPVYDVPLAAYGIKNNKTDAVGTTNGIQQAMDYAAESGYRRIVFPYGTYSITPEARTIAVPTNMIIDFSGSDLHIAPNSLSAIGYTMIVFHNVANTTIMNMHLYGEADSLPSVAAGHESCISVRYSNAYKSGLQQCTISKSPGFNIFGHHIGQGNETGRHPGVKDWEAGQIDDRTGEPDALGLKAVYRTNRFLSASRLGDTYTFGYTQGYFGYPYLRSRLYSIYWYDSGRQFIEAHKYNLQFYVYNKPANAYYAKIVIYQEDAPTAQDNDFSAVAMLRTFHMPVKCFVRKCLIEDNNSCGLAICGGRDWLIEDNTFRNNGKRSPNCDIDWEDGWELSIGDICRRNTFYSRVIICGGNSIALYDNTFMQCQLVVYSRTNNFRVFNNIFEGMGQTINCPIACQADSYLARNIFTRGVNYNLNIHHPGALYKVWDIKNTQL